jgi:hypothetical protein
MGFLRRVILGGDLEAAQVRGQEQDAAPGRPGAFDQLPAGNLDHAGDHLVLRAQPDFRQFQHRLAGLGNRRPLCRRHAGLADMGGEVAPVGGRQQPRQPAGERAEVVQQRQRQTRQRLECEREQGGHGEPGNRSRPDYRLLSA